jgi:hypothetical protein
LPLLVPIVKKRTTENRETGQEEETTYLAGFTSAPVFGIEQTEGDPLPDPDPEVIGWLDNLPLLEVAREWSTEELDAQALTPARLREMERAMAVRAFGEKTERAYIVNEAHGLSKAAIRQLVVLFDRLPPARGLDLHHHL